MGQSLLIRVKMITPLGINLKAYGQHVVHSVKHQQEHLALINKIIPAIQR